MVVSLSTFSQEMGSIEMPLSLEDQALQAQSEVSQIDDHVTMPDMFVSFLAQEPQINPNYERVKGESEAWIAE